MHRNVYKIVLLIFIGSLLAGCESADKGLAETAIKAAEEAINAAKAEVSQYLPDEAKSLEAGLAAVKEKFKQGDFKAALPDAQALAAKTKDLVSAAAARKTELSSVWSEMSAGLPKVVDAIQSRVDILSKSKKLPSGMTAEKLAEAKTGLAEITRQWTEATTASTGGNWMDAVTKGTAVKKKAAEVLAALNMPVPAALKG
jgi:hypothetical protein